ncbi:hypothetical protein LR013_05620 [candidate division NPL-UPA2 bacterium]|nr:hypothetical protein [candidate division NPL-UPA2 bacterium]
MKKASKNEYAEQNPCLPAIGELLGEEFCEFLFGKEAQQWISRRLSPEEFICKVEPYMTKRKWQKLFSLCIDVQHSPQDDGTIFPSGKFFVWGSPADRWLVKVMKYACEKF